MKIPPKSLNNILFATDLSRESEHAVDWVRWLRNTFKARLAVVYVLDVLPYGIEKEELARRKEEAANRLSKFARAHRLSPDAESVLLGADVAVALKQFTEENQTDLVVLGSRATGINRLFLGSISEEMFRTLDTPVMTVGPKVTSAPKAARLQRILFASDLSKQSAAAMDLLPMLLAGPSPAGITMAHFMPPGKGPAVERYRARAKVEQDLLELVPEKFRDNVADIVAEPSTPAEGTVEFTRDHGADMILLGVRAGGPFTRAATHGRPSITHQIIRSAPCPVITVRC
jgi:nucleotide-binding universal stress UspA family protein